ncbi:non-ribosomal peptide synthetase [Pseudonocardia sp. TRM90224]|uniref:non-ribosomal peptide synthetase n=1 Tax=Pseudonocardia sp. TRM90224 TaxID=2812678 RepID=UPI001E3A87F3|nr:non-ribosomal peptide synthetase [Pseudonocardia sp. TRM90224]
MSASTSTSLPLATPAAERVGPVHRRAIAVPPAITGDQAELDTAVTVAVAALVHRYTGEAAVTVGRGSAGVVQVSVTGDTTIAQLRAAVEAAPVELAVCRSFHAVVTDVAAGAIAALNVLSVRGAVELVVSCDEFDAVAADQYAAHLERALAAGPETAVHDIELLTVADLHRIGTEWNRTDEDVQGGFFHAEITAVAQRTPDKDAVVWPAGRMTFGELDEQATRLAHRLRSSGVGRGDSVGTCFPRCPESLIAQLACFKLGAAAILLDPDFPAERIRFMIENAEAVLVLTLAAHEAVVAGTAPVVALDVADWENEPTAPIGSVVETDDVIHICYTSGSTGAPKAVLTRHGAARNLIHGMQKICGITDSSRGTWLAAPGYGMVQVECFSVLAAGATVHIPEPAVVTSPEWLRDWLVARRITHTLVTKAICERILTLEWPAETALQNIRISGERVQSWPAAALPFNVINLYGSAEATVVASCDITELGKRLGAAGRARRTPPIGRPLPNVRTFVLDERMRPVPPGVIGELVVTGDSLSAGYLHLPEATAEKWIPNPLDAARHPVLYRTGDLARCWPDGDIEIVGRTDSQVKVRGNRVNLGEIEAMLTGMPGVAQAVVRALTDDAGSTRLAAYLEAEPGAEPAVRQIRRALQQKLPTFMVPSAFVVGVFELTTNGKIDRSRLPEPPTARPDVETAFEEPRNDIERSLQEIWERALDLDEVGVLDNFFDLGGDSMRAAALTEQIVRFFDIPKSQDEMFFELFDHPSVEGMAAVIAALKV